MLESQFFDLPGSISALSGLSVIEDGELVLNLDGVGGHVEQVVVESLILFGGGEHPCGHQLGAISSHDRF